MRENNLTPMEYLPNMYSDFQPYLVASRPVWRHRPIPYLYIGYCWSSLPTTSILSSIPAMASSSALIRSTCS